MAAEINELFEEGVTRCAELTDVADAAMGAIDEVVEEAEALADSVEKEGAAAREHLRDLVARLEDVQATVTASRAEAGAALESLSGRARTLGSESAVGADRIETAVTRIEEQRPRLADAIDRRMSSTAEAFDDYARKAQALEHEAVERLDQANEVIAGVRAALEAARTEMAGRREMWGASLDRLAATAQEHARAWMEELERVLHRQAEAMVGVANAMVEQHNQSMDAIKTALTEETPSALTVALEPAQDSIRRLAEDAASGAETLAARGAALRSALAVPVPLLDDIRATLQATSELG